jgi:AcrR family transcriptional regulator
MMGQQDKAAGWRGSREGWLAAARQALLDGGVEAVKIQPLAQQLQISRTSFYWFFKDRDDLLNALLASWEEKNTGAFVQACGGYADSIAEAVLSLIAMFYCEEKFEPQLDFAVRSWAHQSAPVTARVHQADEARLAAICDMFQRFGYAPALADVRARTVYLTQIGYISMQVQESMQLRLSRVPAYVETFCGRPPTQAEMARFYAQLP